MAVTFSDGGLPLKAETIKPSVVVVGELNSVMTSPIGRNYSVVYTLGLVSMVFISQLLCNLVTSLTFFFKASPRTFKMLAFASLLSRVKLFVVTQYLFVCKQLQQGFGRNVSRVTTTQSVVAIKGVLNSSLTH